VILHSTADMCIYAVFRHKVRTHIRRKISFSWGMPNKLMHMYMLVDTQVRTQVRTQRFSCERCAYFDFSRFHKYIYIYIYIYISVGLSEYLVNYDIMKMAVSRRRNYYFGRAFLIINILFYYVLFNFTNDSETTIMLLF